MKTPKKQAATYEVMPPPTLLSFVQMMHFREASVRGIYLSVSCDYEKLMDDLITLCELEDVRCFPGGGTLDHKIEAYKVQKVTWLEMGKKLARCKRGLKKYNEEYCSRFEPYFDIIDALVRDRNLMAHGYSKYDSSEQDMSFIIFTNVVKAKPIVKRIEITPFITQLGQYRSAILELAGLVLRLRKEIGV